MVSKSGLLRDMAVHKLGGRKYATRGTGKQESYQRLPGSGLKSQERTEWAPTDPIWDDLYVKSI